MKRTVLSLALISLLLSCSDKETNAKHQKEIAALQQQLDECQNGADKIFAKAEIAYDKQDFETVKALYSEMEKRHPEAPQFEQTKVFYDEVVKIEEAERKEKERLAEEERKNRLASLNKLNKKHDDVSGITWYKQPYFTHYTNTNLTSIYLGQSGGTAYLRLQMTYTGEDWIFFERAYLSYDGNTREIYFDEYDEKDSDHNGGQVWEWIDVTVSGDEENFLREFAKSPNAKMRLSGKYTKTRNLTANERKGILLVLDGYDALQEELRLQ